MRPIGEQWKMHIEAGAIAIRCVCVCVSYTVCPSVSVLPSKASALTSYAILCHTLFPSFPLKVTLTCAAIRSRLRRSLSKELETSVDHKAWWSSGTFSNYEYSRDESQTSNRFWTLKICRSLQRSAQYMSYLHENPFAPQLLVAWLRAALNSPFAEQLFKLRRF